MYYYKIQVNCDDPLDEDDFIILSSEKEYSQFEFSSIVQDCIDECIDLYCNRDTYNNKEPCWYTVDELLNRFNLPFLLKKYGFKLCYTTAQVELQCGRIFSEEFKSPFFFDRSKDKILGQCDCKYKNHSIFKGCPVPHRRRKMNE